jgi:hypothetical protein
MVSACPRSLIFTISVIASSLRRSRLNDELQIAHGTVWSLAPAMISSGPRSGFLVLTLTSVYGLRLAVAAWNSGSPAAGTAYVL